MHQYSLAWYVNLFVRAIEDAELRRMKDAQFHALLRGKGRHAPVAILDETLVSLAADVVGPIAARVDEFHALETVELEGYTAATAEAKAKLSQAQAALAQAQKQLTNVPAQANAASEKLQSQLDALGRENEKLDALGLQIRHAGVKSLVDVDDSLLQLGTSLSIRREVQND